MRSRAGVSRPRASSRTSRRVPRAPHKILRATVLCSLHQRADRLQNRIRHGPLLRAEFRVQERDGICRFQVDLQMESHEGVLQVHSTSWSELTSKLLERPAWQTTNTLSPNSATMSAASASAVASARAACRVDDGENEERDCGRERKQKEEKLYTRTSRLVASGAAAGKRWIRSRSDRACGDRCHDFTKCE